MAFICMEKRKMDILVKNYKKNGYGWLWLWWQKGYKQWLSGWFLKLIDRLFPVSLVLRSTVELDKDIFKKGFYKACKLWFKKLKINYQVLWQKKRFDKKNVCLIFANHPSGLDPYLIAAALKIDLVFIGDVYQAGKGKNLAKQIIKVEFLSSDKTWQKRNFCDKWFGWVWMRLLTGYKKFSSKKIKQGAVNKALNFLHKGRSVLIFPDGGANNFKYWQSGIAIILQKYLSNPEKVKNLQLVMAKITGISFVKLARHFMFDQKKLLADQPVKIFFKKVDLGVFKSHKDSLELLTKLKKIYQHSFDITSR